MFQLVMQIAGMAQRDKLLEGAGGPLVAVAIDRDKSSQSAFRWALDNLVTKGQTLTLIHVNSKASSGYGNDAALQKEVFVPFRCFCTRKDIQYKEVVLEDTDVVTAIVDFVANAAIEKLVIGASPKGGFVRTFRNIDISNSICKGVADFCTVYVISKGKVSSVRNAVRSAPIISPFRNQIQGQPIPKPEVVNNYPKNGMRAASEAALSPWNLPKENDSVKSPFTRGGRAATAKSYGDLVMERDISFVSSGRPSVDRPHRPRRLSNISDFNLDFNFESPRKSVSFHSTENDFFSLAHDSSSSHVSEDVETEIRRLRIELEQTMKMYSTACKEALTAKQKAKELQRWKMEEEQKMKEAREAEEAALALVEKEKAKCLVAIQTAEASKRIAESEAQKRISAEMKSVKEAEQGKKGFEAMSHIRYRKYTIEDIEVATEYFAENRKIGEGGYGPVYRGTLDHTPVAIKVLRPDAAQGRVQFQQEVEILCCIRHPNMVLLLGACPEYGCLVYEYMANGSLEDRLLRRGNTPPIPWQHRFRIAAEIGTGLLFLHQTKPEPLVHRDLKPANILLDRNYVSKIGDVGLARLVPPSVADNVTQCRMTATAGTFCYIDPEYQQTGMLGVKSDIYSLGILLLQLLTGKPPMAISHKVERAIEKGNFLETLDPAVPDWPLEEALSMAKLSIKCAELRRKDRPDLATVVLPELNRLRDVAEENSQQYVLMNNRSSRSRGASPIQTQVSTEELMSGPPTSESVYESTLSQFSAAATMSGIGRY